ncbi:hypothetical protein TIFTF001_035204 [Ficus carica]|uniref:Uncharacterized protein n=1 Tax=Ficus carica TaxID=3494 RepID=A0AA88E195_FICCA|nr:hypothetical protein TIFTF001_035204 [Ficus carica]
MAAPEDDTSDAFEGLHHPDTEKMFGGALAWWWQQDDAGT